jgi:membrane protease YdiL (CAAX protease family)
MTVGTLVPFFGLTFGLTWGLAALLLAFFDRVTAIFGALSERNPRFILAVYAPGLVGVGLVWWHYGLSGLGSFLRRLTLWRMPAAWWLFLLFGIPAIFYAGAAIEGPLDEPFPFTPWTDVLPALAFALLLGPIEEFGRRGVALPLLQRRLAPLWAGLILGLVWATWHLPTFLLSGTPQPGRAFAPFFLGAVALSVLVTPMFNAARGSLLVAVLFRVQANGPVWPDAQPWDTPLFVLAAVLLVVLNRATMPDRGAGVTEVLHPGAERASAGVPGR